MSFFNSLQIHYKEGALDDTIVKTLTSRKTQMFAHSGITDDFPALKDTLAEGIAKEEIKVENVNLDDVLISLVKGE